jgi:uncharacterized SAM-binding protein YcdF (DUF218 family)
MLTLLLSPAPLLLAAMLVLALVAWRKRQRTLAGLAALLAAAFYLATTPLPVHLFSRAWSVPDSGLCLSPPPDATVVVLTGGATGSARSPAELWRLDQATFRRLVHALALARSAPRSELLISGGAETGLTNEARIAEQLILQMGWPTGRLRLEETSSDTYTSARDVRPMLQAGRPLMLVTSSLHMRRAAFIYRKAGLQPDTCSVPDPEALMVPDSLVPHAATLARFSQAWKEVLGLAVYSMRSAPGDEPG